MQGIIKVMGKPKKIYSDQEPAMTTSYDFLKWLTDNKILHITTRGHANTAERAIRTFKDLLTRRIESSKIQPGEVWYDQIRLAVLMKYNQKWKTEQLG